jgi:hypothetical protein
LFQKQDGASIVDLSEDAPERKQDDYSRLLEPNRYAQVITVLTVFTVLGLLVALIAKISMEDGEVNHNNTDVPENTTVAPSNMTGVT